MMEAIATGVEPDQEPDVQLWSGLRAFFGFVGENRASWQVLHRQAVDAGRAVRGRAHRHARPGRVTGRGAAHPVRPRRPATKLEAESLAAALVGAGESLADWWLDHPEEPAGVVAARLMNLVWMGFGDLVDGNVWHPPSRR